MFSALKTPVLLATDGTDEAVGAVAVGAELARARSAVLRMLTVLEPSAYPFSGTEPAAGSIASAAAEAAVESLLRQTVSAQIGAFLGDKAAHEVHFTRGRVVPTIVAESRQAGAGLILLGLHPHDILERLAGEETALRVSRTAGLPVLCVTPSLRQLPRRIVAAVDFSPASVRAAREVLMLAPEGATMVLAHVRPPTPDRNAANARANYSSGVGDALERLRASLPTTKDITIETVTLEGAPVPELLNHALQTGADLIALGAHRHSFVGRLVLGSVATELLRAATVSVFIVPPNGGNGHESG
ncbi:MAG: universal stress protein [Gemmatimonadetes bacterium]|nr:universal stress protein [Gemmatimonadota bacterium]MBI3568940.1 universal stress protein [Gemmatimonadota bacterium]